MTHLPAGHTNSDSAVLFVGSNVLHMGDQGHGPLAAHADLERFVGMMRETVALVREKKAAGKTLEQVKAEGLPEKFKSWGEGFMTTELWLHTLYRGGLSRSEL